MERRKVMQREVIVLSEEEDEVNVAKGGSFGRKLLQSQQSDDQNLIEESTTAAGKTKKVIMKIIKHVTSHKWRWNADWISVEGVQWSFYFIKSYHSCGKYSFSESNRQPVIAIPGKYFHN